LIALFACVALVSAHPHDGHPRRPVFKKVTIVSEAELAQYSPSGPHNPPASAAVHTAASAPFVAYPSPIAYPNAPVVAAPVAAQFQPVSVPVVPVASEFEGPVYQLNVTAIDESRTAQDHRDGLVGPASLSSGGRIRVGAVAAATTSSQKIAKFLSLIKSKIGSKYVFGAMGPSTFDCSGLVYWAARQVGLTTLPRTSGDQYNFGKAITSASARQPGDLIFFGKAGQRPYHVGVYVGPNQMIDAPHTGAFVRQENYSYWPDKLNTARRIF